MLVSSMPELQTKEDIMYIVDSLNIGTDKDAKTKNFGEILDATGSQWSTRMNFFFHNVAH